MLPFVCANRHSRAWPVTGARRRDNEKGIDTQFFGHFCLSEVSYLLVYGTWPKLCTVTVYVIFIIYIIFIYMYVYIHSPSPPPHVAGCNQKHTRHKKNLTAQSMQQNPLNDSEWVHCASHALREREKKWKQGGGNDTKCQDYTKCQPEVALLYQKAKAVCLPATWILFHTLAQSVREMYTCTHAFVCLYFTWNLIEGFSTKPCFQT